MANSYTPEQLRAIETRGGSLLISAAAGSGKTRVLTERLMRYITDPNDPKDLDSFLVITFTRASAAELKSRIHESISKKLADDPGNPQLRKQQLLCYRAQISTMHGFCKNLIAENCRTLDLSPDFRLMDDDRTHAVREKVLETLLEKYYSNPELLPDFIAMADTLGRGQDDSRLQETVLKLYEQYRAHEFPEKWARKQQEALNAPFNDVSETNWGKVLLSEAVTELNYWLSFLNDAIKAVQDSDSSTQKIFVNALSDDLGFITMLKNTAENCDCHSNSWDSLRVSLSSPTYTKLGVLKKSEDPVLSAYIKDMREKMKKSIKSLGERFVCNSETSGRMVHSTVPILSCLLDFVIQFSREYSAEKKRNNELDYDDLEHFAITLLRDPETGAPTELAKQVSRRYTEIMIDEFQDTNEVQNSIFTAISKNNNNLFMVGDIKQSIYRFRLADPTIFKGYMDRYSPLDNDGKIPEGAPGGKIFLQSNFRSRRAILDGINSVFSEIMSLDVGDIDYDESAALYYGLGNSIDMSLDVKPELVLLQPPVDNNPTDSESTQSEGSERSGNDEDSPEKMAAEAAYIAERIASMIAAGTPVCNPNEPPRPCTAADFAVLSRTSGPFSAVAEALERYGISSAVGNKEYLKSPEALVAVDMLTVIDNPHNDIPLISVLRSPAFAFTPDELAAIRNGSPKSDFFTALSLHADSGDPHCSAFLKCLDELRTEAVELSTEELLMSMYMKTSLPELYGAMDSGRIRYENLMMLYRLAESFSDGGGHGLHDFISQIKRYNDNNKAPEVPGNPGNSVSVMTIHGSKGLEFPFVFLCNLDKQFNTTDSQADVPIHSKLGIGCNGTLPECGTYSTVIRDAISCKIKREDVSEEMRILYVAMTRARERLIMTAYCKNFEKILDESSSATTSTVDPWLLLKEKSFARWLIRAAVADPERKITVTGPISTEKLTMKNMVSPESASWSEEEKNPEFLRVSESLNYHYPHSASANIPAKLTASGLSRIANANEQDDDTVVLIDEVPKETVLREPSFMSSSIKAATRGTLTHKFLELLDFSQTDSYSKIKLQLDGLVQKNIFTEEEAKSIYIKDVQKLFSSPIGFQMINASDIRREFRFTVLVNATDYYPEAASDEQILMQGVVDCCIINPDGITVIDYKTDHVIGEEISERAKHYNPQLSAYSKALSRIFNLPVLHTWLYFLYPGTAVEVVDI